MRGYTAKKGNRYYAVIYEGVDPATGKERRRWHPAGTRKADADKLVTELVKRHNDGEYRGPQKVSTGAYLTQRWLPAQRSQLKATTFDSYRRTIELHVLPALGAVQLARLTPEDLDTLYRAVTRVWAAQHERSRSRAQRRERSLRTSHLAQGARRCCAQRQPCAQSG